MNVQQVKNNARFYKFSYQHFVTFAAAMIQKLYLWRFRYAMIL